MKKRLVQIGVLLIPALLLTALALAYTAHQRLVVRKAVQQLQIRNKQHVAKIQHIIAQHKQNLESLANNSTVKKLALQKKPWTPARTKQLRDAVTDLNATFQFKNLVLLTKQGRALFTLYPNTPKKALHYQKNQAFDATLRLGKTTLSQLQFYENFEGVRACLATPLSLHGQTAAVAIATVETEALHRLVADTANSTNPMETVIAFAQDKHLHIIGNHPMKPEVSHQTILRGDPRVLTLQQALGGETESGASTNLRGSDTLAASQRIAHADIVVMTQINKQQVIWPVLRIYLIAAGIVLLVNMLLLLLLQNKQQQGSTFSPYLPSTKRVLQMFFWQLLVLSILATGSFFYRYQQDHARMHRHIDGQVRFQLTRAGQYISQHVKNIETAAETLADKLSTQHLTHKQIEKQLRHIVQEQPDILGIGAAYRPYAYQENLRLYAPYILRHGTDLRALQVEETYDYTLPESPGNPKTNWYNNPLKANRSFWLKPYFGSASKALLSSYVVPFYSPQDKQNKNPIGVVEIMQNMAGIRRLADQFSLHGIGYPFIINRDGTYVYHPIEDYVRQQLTIQDISRREGQVATQLLIENFVNQQRKDTFSHMQGLFWTYAAPIPQTDWIFAITFRQELLEKSRQALKPLLAGMVVCGFFASVLAMTLVLCSCLLTWRKSRVYSFFFSVAALCALLTLWGYMLTEPPRINLTNGTAITEQAELERYMSAFMKGHVNPQTVTEIPTGIKVDSIEFIDFYNTRVGGSCWQKYAKGKQLKQGIVFTNAVQSSFQEIYREDTRNFETVGWSFTATLSQKNDYWRYPFDSQNVAIFLENIDLNTDAILTPDIDSYTTLYPTSTPGVSNQVKDEISIKKSMFLYLKKYDSNLFGLSKNSNLTNTPNLVFQIGIKRKIISSIMTYIVPLISILIFIYIVILIYGNTYVKDDDLRNSSLTNAYLTLFFTIILLHRFLRDAMSSGGVFYIEHFLLTCYAIILICLMAVFLESRSLGMRWVTHILKVAFWPFTLTSWLFSTVYVFLH